MGVYIQVVKVPTYKHIALFSFITLLKKMVHIGDCLPYNTIDIQATRLHGDKHHVVY